MKIGEYKYRIAILILGLVSVVSAISAGLSGNLMFYNSFTSSRYLAEGLLSWRISKTVPIILLAGLCINITAVIIGKPELAFMSSAAFAFNNGKLSWILLSRKGTV